MHKAQIAWIACIALPFTAGLWFAIHALSPASPAAPPSALMREVAIDKPSDKDTEISFNRDIRPILSDKCFACHGPDAAVAVGAGGFRLDVFEEAIKPAASGDRPIVPGNADASEVLKRIAHTNPKLVMPPPRSKVTVTADEAELLRRWINEGAKYQGHWAYESPTKPALPALSDASEKWARNNIDRFIAARLEKEGLSPSKEADATTLIRRVTLDLTGLPPTPEQIDAFVADPSPDAYEKLVDRLLASPHFGERMAILWLDAARYSDTIGYQLDHARNAWPYRDWVINAFNANMPYDQFIIEQLAGDLLPNATQQQILATAFCRMHMMNHEGGALDEEYRIENVADRIETIATVFMAQTYNCARCHDHKYDPTTQDDYYAMFAYFGSIPEKGVYNNKPDQALAYPPRIDWLPPGVTDPKQAVPISIMKELDKPRIEYVLERGDYSKKITTRPAQRTVPSYINLPLPDDAPNNRLGFALWLTQPNHPLTARVHVNRLWQMIFGKGIVATPEDFGSQSNWPSHPQLLDYLAIDFVESKWNQKSLLKQIVTSATYKQQATRQLKANDIDPDNRLLSYFPRQRMPGEFIRDNALAAAELLNRQIGGPSVKPYQPEGLWREIAMRNDSSTYQYHQDDGDKLYRRSIYTFHKRKLPPPQLAAFGTPNREACIVYRDITNTPMQVLVLWNDEQFLEAARVLAQNATTKYPTDQQRITDLLLRCTGQAPDKQQLDILLQTLNHFRSRFDVAPEDAISLLKQGKFPLPDDHDTAELAAWMMIASTVLSLDQTIVRD